MSNDELATAGHRRVRPAPAGARRRCQSGDCPQVIARIGLIFAATILFLLAFSLRWPPQPLNVPAAGLAVLELIIAAAAINAMRSASRWAMAGALGGLWPAHPE